MITQINNLQFASGGSEPFCKKVPTPPKTFYKPIVLRSSPYNSAGYVRFVSLIALLCVLFFVLPLAGENGAAPVFIKKARAVEKEFTLELYGNFLYERTTTIYSPIVGLITNVGVAKGEKVKKFQPLLTVLRDAPGFTTQENKIKAPFSGLVTSIMAYEGSRISPSTPLMKVASFDPIYLYANIAEEDRGKIQPGDKVNIKVSYLDEPVSGQVVNFLDIDPMKKMAKVRIRAANPGAGITAGSEGKIRFTFQKKQVVIIPAEAVFAEQGRYFAWVSEAGKAAKREILIGELTSGGFECLSGIDAGEEVIYYGYLDLKPGDPVQAVQSLESTNEH